jgi:hypothetical protein
VAKATTMTTSRAVLRTVEAGNSAMCVHCGAQVKFVARAQLKQVIANVYEEGVWKRVEHYHADCYTEANEPYGPAAIPEGRG